ncbi:hypothetical protein F5884DRAFT_812615 [Xylogone sp. PMI_703]|nr:hypothetical protein F5884DRAFT_812615 [Xylogone sp. PMI_703]
MLRFSSLFLLFAPAVLGATVTFHLYSDANCNSQFEQSNIGTPGPEHFSTQGFQSVKLSDVDQSLFGRDIKAFVGNVDDTVFAHFDLSNNGACHVFTGVSFGIIQCPQALCNTYGHLWSSRLLC